ncbi:hypothetical protein F5X99DRAFT_372693 [Biscogniauxia marginata]|nr:hypothetical protein F5X99DRAFT_372693 [Biscogniauxia marginata]
MDPDHIDTLLERYLHLLHEYTSLREQLSTLQAGMYQDIARANFSAERGMRFGRDHYDERMQASRRLAVALDDRGVPSFTAITTGDGDEGAGASSSSVAQAPKTTTPASDKEDPSNSNSSNTEKREDENDISPREPSPEKEKEKKKMRRDPLNWFGLLAPAPLRQAQAQSVRAVDHVIPRLVSVGAEMAQLEIEVRRARKRRAKAEAAAAQQERERERERETVSVSDTGKEGIAA